MQIIGSIGVNHFFYRGMLVGGQARSALVSIIFDKAMTISGRAKAGGNTLQPLPTGILPGSEEEKKHLEVEINKEIGKKGNKKHGESNNEDCAGWRNSRIVNLMSVDTSRIDQAFGWLHMVWGSPISIILTIILLLINLTSSALPGIGLFIVTLPIIGFAMKLMFKRRGVINKLTDQRVSITQEVLQSIRFVKYYAWETDFMKRLADLRKREIGGIRLLLGTRQLVSAVGIVIPVFASMLAFITYSLTGHFLNPASVFSSLALFNQMRMPLIILPFVLSTLLDAAQSLRRIEQFLLSEDSTDTTIQLEHGDFAVDLQDASFTWEQSERPDPDEPLLINDIDPMGPTGKRGKAKNAEAAAKTTAKGKKKDTKSGIETPPEPGNERLDRPPFTINHINLQVGSSELIAIIGEVGSGKSSLLSAIGKLSSRPVLQHLATLSLPPGRKMSLICD